MAIVPLAAETLRSPSPCDHLIQAYTDDAFLAETVGEFIATGLKVNEGAIIIATPKHLGLFGDSLQALRIDVANNGICGRYPFQHQVQLVLVRDRSLAIDHLR